MKFQLPIFSVLVCALAIQAVNTSEMLKTGLVLNQHCLQKQVDAFYLMNNQQEVPKHLLSAIQGEARFAKKRKDDFDANRYFKILNRLSMEPEYTLDYFYWGFGGNGRPRMYARKVEDKVFVPRARIWYDTTKISDEDLVDSLVSDVFSHVIADGTPESFFQLAMLYLMGGQFYLAWHCNYTDDQIVCEPAGVGAILTKLNSENFGSKPSGHFAATAMRLDVAARSTMTDSTCAISLMKFSRWGGFSRLEFVFQRDFPHILDTVIYQSELEYDCGILF